VFKPLFDENGHYTQEANTLANDVCRDIHKFFGRGYSPREVFTIVCSEVTSQMAAEMIALGLKRRKENAKTSNSEGVGDGHSSTE
jgi:hypothetical protein